MQPCWTAPARCQGAVVDPTQQTPPQHSTRLLPHLPLCSRLYFAVFLQPHFNKDRLAGASFVEAWELNQSHLPLAFQRSRRAVHGRRCSEMNALLLANYCNRSLATGRGRNELCMLRDKKDRMERGFSYGREWERNITPGMREGCIVSPDTTQNPHTPPHPHQPPPSPPLLHPAYTTALQPQDELVVNNNPTMLSSFGAPLHKPDESDRPSRHLVLPTPSLKPKQISVALSRTLAHPLQSCTPLIAGCSTTPLTFLQRGGDMRPCPVHLSTQQVPVDVFRSTEHQDILQAADVDLSRINEWQLRAMGCAVLHCSLAALYPGSAGDGGRTDVQEKKGNQCTI